MRIQHNITAMNAYRNYNNNTSAIGKNLEKLSSGYKINRAGDDAAGLAVSQKMRLQIAGLQQAQKNAKSGISYVQTAEGALQEVHEMLERMYTLAEQSANGTFDSTTDRTQLQKEVNSLMEEINRIGQTANFNGIGIFAEYAGAAASTPGSTPGSTAAPLTISGTVGGAALTPTSIAAASAVAAKYTITVTTAIASGVTGTLTVAGVDMTIGSGGGEDIDLSTDTTAAQQAAAIASALNNNATFSAAYTASASGSTVIITKTVAGVDASAAVMASVTASNFAAGSGLVTATVTATGANAVAAASGYDLAGLTASDALVIDGKTYTFTTAATAGAATLFSSVGDLQAKLGSAGVTMTQVGTTGSIYTFTKASGGGAAGSATGSTAGGSTGSTAGGSTGSTAGGSTGSTAGGGTGSTTGGTTASTAGGGPISFWIGAENIGNGANQLTIQTMHLSVDNISIEAGTSAVGVSVDGNVATGIIASVDITTATSAMNWLNTIKDASNAVSNMRGSLGAMQNRLDHTLKNLSVMQENMQDAESVIRDTDVAEEMMAYTKNSILVQSAQAMLAQANQLPQGVLQLLQ